MMKIGGVISKFITEKNSTIELISDQCGMSTAQFCQILDDKITPSISTLIKISRALDVTVDMLTDGSEQSVLSITHKDSRILTYGNQSSDNDAMSFHSLAPAKMMRSMEPFMITLTRDEGVEKPLSSHEGEEFVYVLRGEVELTLGNEVMNLIGGDSIYYDSVVPHAYKSMSESSKLLAVLYNPW
ncbi:MAG: XRE family transcriptional regulator [Rikenellaceae bacterium]